MRLPALSSELPVHLRCLPVICFPAVTFLPVRCLPEEPFPRYLSGYISSRTFLRVIYSPPLSCWLCVFPRFLAGYLFTRAFWRLYTVSSRAFWRLYTVSSRAFWRFRVMCFEHFPALSFLCFPALRTGCDCFGFFFLHSSRFRSCSSNLI